LAASALLNGAAIFLGDRKHPRECISVQNLACSEEAEPVKLAMIQWQGGRAGDSKSFDSSAIGRHISLQTMNDIEKYELIR
jgi:hypothetical protein